MWEGLFRVDWNALAIVAVRSAIIYVVLLVGLRLFGKREVGQFTLFDLVLVLLVANAVQPAMTGPDTSLLGGFVIVAVLLIINRVIAYLRLHSFWARKLIEGTPTIIAQRGEWVSGALLREGLDQDDAQMALREHGIDDVSQVGLAVLETDGSISVVANDDVVRTRRRHTRYRKPL
jgi:uncharacterized membrane protein YcaP (DUF421 family)